MRRRWVFYCLGLLLSVLKEKQQVFLFIELLEK